jgi:HAD superfamily hydrolase (TIGR01493 family)
MPAPLWPTLPPRAILFDCDGTLLLTSDLHFRAIADAVACHGGTMPRDWYMALTGLGRRDTLVRLMQDFGVKLDNAGVMADSIARTVARAGDAVENPSVAAVARQAAGRLPIAVVTNREAAIAHAFLAQTGLRALFDCIVTCEDAAHPKPAPDLYLLAAERIGVAPSDCLVLEDSEQGLCAAQSAGMACLDVRADAWPRTAAALLDLLRTCPARGAVQA